jgi:hypothetical protein
MRTRVLLVLGALVALLAVAVPAQAIKGGVPDAGVHPYVGQLLFYDPTAIDPRFDDPGGWFNCSGTLVSPRIVVTAGHCTFGTGLNGEPTASGAGGNDVWISFAEEPDYSILPPSSEFIPDDNQGRYEAWSAALNASDEWIRATAFPHPEYDDAAFFTHDLGVLRLSEPVNLPEYGQLPTLGLLDQLLQGGQAAALHRGGLRPGGLGAQDLVRGGHPAAGGAAVGQPQRSPGDRQGRVGEVLQQRQHRRHLLR